MTRAGRDGFSLVEAIIALAILAVGLMALVRMFPLALRQAQGAAERTEVTQLADSRLGDIRAQNALHVLEYFPQYTAGNTTLDALRSTKASYELYQGYAMSFQRTGGAGKAALTRVVLDIKLEDDRYERFVTYVAVP